MRERDPDNRQLQREASERPPKVRESSRTVLALAIAFAVAVAIGAYFLGFAENNISVTSKAPTITQQSSSTSTPDKTGRL